MADAVNGMIRIAVQKQMALFTYQLQQMLNEQAPGLVDDVLEHNVKRILDDMKTEMKYRRWVSRSSEKFQTAFGVNFP